MTKSRPEKLWRVISPLGVSWTARFVSADTAWGRVLSANGIKQDTRAGRLALEADGWQVVERTHAELGSTL